MKRFFDTIIFLLLIGLMAGCSQYEDKTFSLNDIDEQGCQSLSGSIRVDTTWQDTTIVSMDSVIIVDTILFAEYDRFSTAWTADSLFQNIPQFIDSLTGWDTRELSASLGERRKKAVIDENTSQFFNLNSSGMDTSYTLIDYSNRSETELVIYLDDYLEARLFHDTGEECARTMDQMDLETYAYCRQIKTRIAFTTGSGRFLMQLIRTDKTVNRKFFMTLLRQP